jgi:hypothetical protein
MIDVIGNATLCEQWTESVKSSLEIHKVVPPFLRSFYNLVSSFDETTDSPWIQRYMKDTVENQVVDLRKRFVDISDDLSPKMKNKYTPRTYDQEEDPKVTKKKKDADAMLIEKTTKTTKSYLNMMAAKQNLTNKDAINQDYIDMTTDRIACEESWSVLSLFFHSAICNVEPTADKAKGFAFWPTAGPLVNNRHVEIGQMVGEDKTGYVEEMCFGENYTWSAQAARIVPYCVTNDKSQSTVSLHTIIATTTKGAKTSMEGTVTYQDDDSFAGTLRAQQITFDEVCALYQALTGLNLRTTTYFGRNDWMKDGDRAFMGLHHCLSVLNAPEYYNGLETVQDWCKLYVQLSMDEQSKIDWSEVIMHPTTANDLVHKTRLLLMSKHKVRFSLLEGQKRETSCTYGLLGFYPRDHFIFHGDVEMIDRVIGGERNIFNRDVDHNDPKIYDGDITAGCTFWNAGKRVMVYCYHFKTFHDDFNPLVVETCRKFSTFLVHQGNQEQVRSWMHIVTMLTENEKIIEALKYCMETRNAWTTNATLVDYIFKTRRLIMQQIYVFESHSKCLEADCADSNDMITALKTYKEEKFLNTALLKLDLEGNPHVNKKGQQENKNKIKALGIDFKSPPYPKICHSIIMMFFHVAFGFDEGLILLKNVIQLQGKRSTKYTFRSDFKFAELEQDYMPKVSFLQKSKVRCNSTACRGITS